ncbi:MAG: hypothetical protein ABSC95_04995 [Acetobacteraceae bacterium]
MTQNIYDNDESSHGSLPPDGNLVFSVEHPIYTAPAEPGWLVSARR